MVDIYAMLVIPDLSSWAQRHMHVAADAGEDLVSDSPIRHPERSEGSRF
jgi:hypothetical protein